MTDNHYTIKTTPYGWVVPEEPHLTAGGEEISFTASTVGYPLAKATIVGRVLLSGGDCLVRSLVLK